MNRNYVIIFPSNYCRGKEYKSSSYIYLRLLSASKFKLYPSPSFTFSRGAFCFLFFYFCFIFSKVIGPTLNHPSTPHPTYIILGRRRVMAVTENCRLPAQYTCRVAQNQYYTFCRGGVLKITE